MFEADDDDFSVSSSTNLSSIFNTSLHSDVTADLSYKAPKQPKAQRDNSGADSQQNSEKKVGMPIESSVILAQVITLWKLHNKQTMLLGKHILAIIGNTNQNLYEIIVYQNKTNILIRQSLDESLILYKYPKHFVGIFDNKKQFWNFNFDKVENVEHFLKEISVYKCQIVEQKSPTSVDNDKMSVLTNSALQRINSEEAEPPLNEPNHRESISKDKILSRITKVGQQIIPTTAVERNPSTELSDSESDSINSDLKPSKPITAPRKFRRNLNHETKSLTPVMAENNNLHNTYMPNNSHTFLNNNQMALNTHGMMYAQPYPDYSVNNFIIAQNMELKTNLAEINSKLGLVLGERIDKNRNTQEDDNLKSRNKCLCLKIENLQSDLSRLNESMEDLKRKYGQKCSELINEQEKNKACDNLVQEVDRLKGELQEVEILKKVNQELNLSIKDKEELIESQKLKLNDYENADVQNQSERDKLKMDIGGLNTKIEELTLKIKEYEEKLTINSNELPQNDLTLQRDILNKTIKETMNKTFNSIMEQFSENYHYNSHDIQEVVLENLKRTTYDLIDGLK